MPARPVMTEKEARDQRDNFSPKDQKDLQPEVAAGNPGPADDDQGKAAEAESGASTGSASVVDTPVKHETPVAPVKKEKPAPPVEKKVDPPMNPNDAAAYFFDLLPQVNQKQFMDFCYSNKKEPYEAIVMILTMGTENNQALANARRYDQPITKREYADNQCPVCGKMDLPTGQRFCSNKCGALYTPEA